MTLVLSGPIRDAIREHARSGAPEEVVGVLAGDRRGTKASVSRAYRTKNTADRPRPRDEIDPGEAIGLLERIDAAGLKCVGVYHSPPAGPTAPG